MIAFTSLYFLIIFLIDATRENKVWQFKSLVKDSDAASPIPYLRESADNISKLEKDIVEHFIQLTSKEQTRLNLDETISTRVNAGKLLQTEIDTDELEAEIERQRKLIIYQGLMFKARDAALQRINAKRELLNFEIKALETTLPGVKRSNKIRYFINITFPVVLCGVSLLMIAYYFLKWKH